VESQTKIRPKIQKKTCLWDAMPRGGGINIRGIYMKENLGGGEGKKKPRRKIWEKEVSTKGKKRSSLSRTTGEGRIESFAMAGERERGRR